ncbi:hypothetical protein, partial [Oceanospirillum sediminis]|uniref:hypothetical protein n=1 Tax=Oceanospirillum sediminis TaxID=2760088 RepID=UPI001C7298A5
TLIQLDIHHLQKPPISCQWNWFIFNRTAVMSHIFYKDIANQKMLFFEKTETDQVGYLARIRYDACCRAK